MDVTQGPRARPPQCVPLHIFILFIGNQADSDQYCEIQYQSHYCAQCDMHRQHPFLL